MGSLTSKHGAALGGSGLLTPAYEVLDEFTTEHMLQTKSSVSSGTTGHPERAIDSVGKERGPGAGFAHCGKGGADALSFRGS